MLLRISIAILTVALIYIFGIYSGALAALTSAFIIGGTLYFLKERSQRAASLNFLTLLLALAVVVLGHLKGIGAPGLFPLSLAILFTFTTDFRLSGAARFLVPLPFWFFTAWAVGEIFAARYGKWGLLLGLVVIPIYLRDALGGHKGENEREDEQIQKTE